MRVHVHLEIFRTDKLRSSLNLITLHCLMLIFNEQAGQTAASTFYLIPVSNSSSHTQKKTWRRFGISEKVLVGQVVSKVQTNAFRVGHG